MMHEEIVKLMCGSIPKKMTIAAAVSVLAVLCIPAVSFAQESDEPEYSRPSPIESSQVVRRKLLFRSTRLEVAPLVGFTLADPFNRNILAGANAGFHLTNEFGIGATFGYSLANPETSLSESLKDPASNVPADQLNDFATTRINWVASVEGSYVPLFGKLSIMNGLILNYDFHLIFGVGFINQAGVAATGVDNLASDNVATSTVAPTVGIGTRFYINDFLSFNTELRDYIYSSPVISNGLNNDADLQNRLMLSLGISIFLPRSVKVSR